MTIDPLDRARHRRPPTGRAIAVRVGDGSPALARYVGTRAGPIDG